MDDANDKSEVREVLESLGLTMSVVPESDAKRCDFQGYDNTGERYLIEVKGIHDNDELHESMKKEGEYFSCRSLDVSDRVGEVIEYAIKQLKETPQSADSLWFVALINRTVHGADVTDQQIVGTLYGTSQILSVEPSKKTISRKCLYFSHSAFHRHPELDAVIVIDLAGWSFFLNDFGRRIDRVRNCLLGRTFARRDGLNDASVLSSRHGFLLADCALDRKDEAGMLEHVKKKYGFDFALVVNPTRRTAMARVGNPT